MRLSAISVAIRYEMCTEMDDRLGAVTIPHEAGPARHKREIGDRSGHQEELEESLRPPEVASLAHAELHQPRQPMFGGLT
jgi:hypothetical protein